ncbi:DUF7120 family protein [Halorarum halobium]|uniref:DUF7120 family protein n=1 Tax=Halorarum halobium TaxID=3075121 RepID=UPI0028ABD06B|nr:CopG family transcriptional regulator [Halobaculum sp. XH14]
MTRVTVDLSDQTESDLQRLVDQGEFISRDQAIEDLLSRGLSAYQPVEDSPNEMDETMFDRVTDEQQDPAIQDDEGGDPRF